MLFMEMEVVIRKLKDNIKMCKIGFESTWNRENRHDKCVRTLDACMGPELKWNTQFEIMKEKMREEIGKFKSTLVFAPTSHVFSTSV